MFVRSEPAFFEYLTIFLAMVYYQNIIRYLLNAPIALFLASTVLSAFIEWYFFSSIRWSMISFYLVLVMLVGASLAIDGQLRPVLIGAVLAFAAYALIGLVDLDSMLYGSSRFMGFFKDPNVLGGTAMALGLLALHFGVPLAAPFFLLMVLSLSRAAFLALVVSLLLFYMLRRVSAYRFVIGLLAITMPLGVLLWNIDHVFALMGRGGLINPYDYDRTNNWIIIVEAWTSSFGAIGPTWSERNGYAVHSSYLRVVFEQGPLNFAIFVYLLIYAFRCSWGNKHIRLALLALILCGAVIDTTHWRILFLVIGFAIGSAVVTREQSKMHYVKGEAT